MPHQPKAFKKDFVTVQFLIEKLRESGSIIPDQIFNKLQQSMENLLQAELIYLAALYITDYLYCFS